MRHIVLAVALLGLTLPALAHPLPPQRPADLVVVVPIPPTKPADLR
jgi:hypothetical protein